MPPRRTGQQGLSPFSSDYEPAFEEVASKRGFVLPAWLPTERGAVFFVTVCICMMIAVAGSPGAHPGGTPTPAGADAPANVAANVPTASAAIGTAAPQQPTPAQLADVQLGSVIEEVAPERHAVEWLFVGAFGLFG